jgi:hypothetical protein
VAIVRALARRVGVRASGDLRINLIAGCSTMAVRAALVQWAQSSGKLDLIDLTRQAFETLEKGLGGHSTAG